MTLYIVRVERERERERERGEMKTCDHARGAISKGHLSYVRKQPQ